MEKKFVFNVDETSEIVAKALANVYYEKHKEDESFSIPADSLKVAVEAANLGGAMMLDKINAAVNNVPVGFVTTSALCDFNVFVDGKFLTTVKKAEYVVLTYEKWIKNPDKFVKLKSTDPDYFENRDFCFFEPTFLDLRMYDKISFEKVLPRTKFTAKWYEFS